MCGASVPAPPSAPPWDLLCLRAYLQSRTRHSATLVDARTFTDFERELVEALRAVPAPFALVVYCEPLSVGETAAVLEIARRHFARLTTVVCGPFPSQFPAEAASALRTDYALAGDPEPILRNLLDHLDVPQRLARVPGLLRAGATVRPHWLERLDPLSLPDWTGLFWPAYERRWPRAALCAEARWSRGHTGEPGDRAFSEAGAPLRLWPADRMAQMIQKAAAFGLQEVFLTDPPGLWTRARLATWCAALDRARVTQPWGLRLLPRALSEDDAAQLAWAHCRRIELLFPSAHPDVWPAYGCEPDLAALARTVDLLRAHQIRVEARFWIGGPEARRGEADRIASLVRLLRYPPTTLEAFPVSFDSPLYREFGAAPGAPRLADWIRWARAPWMRERPVPLWGGPDAARVLRAAMARARRAVARSPQRAIQRAVAAVRSRPWIRLMEDKALAWLARVSPPKT